MWVGGLLKSTKPAYDDSFVMVRACLNMEQEFLLPGEDTRTALGLLLTTIKSGDWT